MNDDLLKQKLALVKRRCMARLYQAEQASPYPWKARSIASSHYLSINGKEVGPLSQEDAIFIANFRASSPEFENTIFGVVTELEPLLDEGGVSTKMVRRVLEKICVDFGIVERAGDIGPSYGSSPFSTPLPRAAINLAALERINFGE